MKVAIHQPNYFPWIGYFYKMSLADVFVVLDDSQYSKNGYQNRVKIKTPTGSVWMTQPVCVPQSKNHEQMKLNYQDTDGVKNT